MRHSLFRACVLAWGLGLTLLLTRSGMGAEDSVALENKVKAACVYHFASLTEWPATAFPNATTPLVIGLAGEVPFASLLERGVQGKSIGGRKITVRLLSGSAEADQCHVLFIGAMEPERAAALLAGVATKPIVTVSESEGFIERGGMLNLVKTEGSVKFEASRASAARVGLKLSSQLLKLAVAGKGAGPLGQE